MKVAIVGCGESGKDWTKIPVDLSVGVNDCNKFGHPVEGRHFCDNVRYTIHSNFPDFIRNPKKYRSE